MKTDKATLRPAAAETSARLSSPRDRGMIGFVVRYGLLGWGVTGGLVYFLMELARKADNLPTHALYAATIFPAIGLAGGLLLWFFGGKKKKRP